MSVSVQVFNCVLCIWVLWICLYEWKKRRKFHAFLLDFALEPDVGVGGGCFVFSAIDDFEVDAVLDFLCKIRFFNNILTIWIVNRGCVFI